MEPDAKLLFDKSFFSNNAETIMPFIGEMALKNWTITLAAPDLSQSPPDTSGNFSGNVCVLISGDIHPDWLPLLPDGMVRVRTVEEYDDLMGDSGKDSFIRQLLKSPIWGPDEECHCIPPIIMPTHDVTDEAGKFAPSGTGEDRPQPI